VVLWHLIVANNQLSPVRAIGLWLLHFAFVGVLIVISFIDLATFRIPNTITYPGIPLFTAASLLLPHAHWWDGPVGALAGYACLRLLSDGYFWVTGREGMGYGDAKLLALTAGFLGWQSLLPTIFVGSLVGSIVGITTALLARRAGESPSPSPSPSPSSSPSPRPSPSPSPSPSSSPSPPAVPAPASIRHMRVPFGPFLAIGALVFLFVGDPLDHVVHLLLP
jgi:prepilin signal peptidase PulO-like enzyme (type II secretory pathway)